MTTEPIFESKMTFGPYPVGHCFYIERSATYRNIQDSVKMAEFLLLRSQTEAIVWIVEAKSSTPHPANQPDFNTFIEEIREKLANALTLGIAICLKRHSASEESPSFLQTLDLTKASFRLILVINEHPESWLPPLQEALRKALTPTIQIWNLPPIACVVLNDSMARSQGLIR